MKKNLFNKMLGNTNGGGIRAKEKFVCICGKKFRFLINFNNHKKICFKI